MTTIGNCTAPITWVNADEDLPDDEITVLLALEDGEVWTGYHDGGRWYYASGDLISTSKVLHWANFPTPPSAQVPTA